MNKRKNMFITLLIMFFSFVCVNKVTALYNGSGGTGYDGGSRGDCGSIVNCSYNNSNMLIMQARLYYINNGSFSHIGKTYYFVNKNASDFLAGKGLNLIYISAFDGYGKNYQKASKYLKETYFGNTATNQKKDTAITFLNNVTSSDNYLKVLTKKSEFANKTTAAKKGYRIIIEPANNYANPSFSNNTHALITVKGMAGEVKGGAHISCLGTPGATTTVCGNPLLGNGSQAQLLFTNFKDVGISAASKEICEKITINGLADIKKGCGYNIVDISQYVDEPECYVSSLNGALTCDNTDENNVTDFTETYTKLEKCPADISEDEQQQISKDGKIIGTTIGTCTMYCKESAIASFPGNVGNLIQRGSYFAWPTRPDDTKGLYSMSMQSTFTCKIQDEGAADTVAATYTRKCIGNTTEFDEDNCRSKTETKTRLCPKDYYLSGTTCYSNATYCANGVKENGKCKITTYYCASGYTLSGKKCYTYACPSDSQIYSGSGSNMLCTKTEKVCPSGWNPYGTSGTECAKNATPIYSYKCSEGSLNESSCLKNATTTRFCPSGTQNGEWCYRSKAPNASCPQGWTKVTEYKCKKYTSSKYTCPSGWTPYGTSGSQCKKNATKYISSYSCKEGDLKSSMCVTKKENKTTIFKATKVEVNAYTKVTYENPYSKTTASTCPEGTGDSGGKCYILSEKVTTDYRCPKGYTLNGKTCVNNCDKTKLINNVKEILKNNKYEAHLTAGTNNPLTNIKLQIAKIEENYDDNKLVFTKKVYFKIPSDATSGKNRYYNKITGIVSDSSSLSNTIFDRGEGVVSTSLRDKILVGNNIKKYELKITGVKLGTNNQFGEKITNYTCNYSVTDNGDDCVCPDGTTNAGVSIKYLKKQLCESEQGTENKTCVDWQNDLCNYDGTNGNEIEECTVTNKFYCIDSKNSKKDNPIKIDITSCVRSLMASTGSNLEESITKCTNAQSKCTNEYCINSKTGEQILIKDCLENNSRMACYEKYGCLLDICEPGKCCTGKCNWTYKNLEKMVYGIQTCNNDGRTNQYCGFEVYCSTDKTTSKSAKQCIEQQLNTNDVLKKISTGLNQSELQRAITACETKVCSVNSKIVYRTIDLTNPFPGKSDKRNEVGFSLLNQKSRTPGYNWNSKNTVKEKILNARGVEGYNLYNKQPLITITLTPNDIKEIRKYNEKTAYNDFKLKCVNNDESSSCISYFLHSSSTTLGKNLNIKGVSNCTKLNASSNVQDFNKCYNSNN